MSAIEAAPQLTPEEQRPELVAVPDPAALEAHMQPEVDNQASAELAIPSPRELAAKLAAKRAGTPSESQAKQVPSDEDPLKQADELTERMKAAGFDFGDEKPARKPAHKKSFHKKAELVSVVSPTSTEDLSDIGIRVDARGMGHRTGKKGNRFISKDQLAQIRDRADDIRADQQGTREEWEAREAARQTELDSQVDAEAKRLAFKRSYGSRALERVEGLKKSLDDEAAANLAGEGNDMAYRTEASADQELSIPEGFDAAIWDILDGEERQRAVEAWADMSDEQRAAAFAGKPEHNFDARTADMDQATRDAYFANANAAQPVQDLTPKSLRDRVKGIFGWAKQKATEAYVTVGNKIVNPQGNTEVTEEQLKRRRIIAAVGIGAVATASAYALWHGFHHGGGSGNHHDVANHTGKGGHSGHTGAGKVAPKFDKVKLHHGDSIWKLEEARHPHMNEQHIRDLVQHDLQLNHLNWEEARHLADGQEVKLGR